MGKLLEVKDLKVRFDTPEGVVRAVNGISFSLEERETLGIVGESGCGKSVSMLSILRLLPKPAGKIESGQVVFAGKELLALPEEELRKIRGAELAMVFQDPMTSLNPILPVGLQIVEAITAHQGVGQSQAKARAVELLNLVGIPKARDRMGDYCHQFSGGMRQRVMIAMALSCKPRLLIADEPTTALDVTIQAQIVDLVKQIQNEFGMAVIWITHDLGLIARLARRVIVMYSGYIVEEANIRDLYHAPRHPYSRGLMGSIPRLDEEEVVSLVSIPGQPPNLTSLSVGCPFAPRCGYTAEQCLRENPTLLPVRPGAEINEPSKMTYDHFVACWETERLSADREGDSGHDRQS